LVSTFSSPVSTSDGFTVNLTNYDEAFTYSLKTSRGRVTSGSATGALLPITVTGLSAGQSATVTVTTTRSGHPAGRSSITGSATSP
jgi:hypothetical protein